MRPRGSLLFATAAILCLAFTAGEVRAQERSFALVIGSNSAGGSNGDPLRFADDDAALSAELMIQLGARVVLLTSFDPDTAALHPTLTPSPATEESVEEAARLLAEEIAAAKESGARTAFYVFYSGHGDVEHNEGFVNLDRGRLFRRELTAILESSPADVNHVIIDACNSYYMVFERGPGGERIPLQGMMDLSEEGLPDDTGVFLSTSSAAESHEWAALGSGVFSHEMRSAMRGAADLDLDGAVSYTEAAAFVWTANKRISNSRLRPSFYSRPPIDGEDEDPTLSSLEGASGDKLHLPAEHATHSFLEDAAGLRLADLHPAEGQSVILLIPERRPLFLRQPADATEREIPAGDPIYLSAIPTRTVEVSARGSEHEAFMLLFANAFDDESVDDYRRREPELLSGAPPVRQFEWLRRSLGIGALVVAGAGGALTGLAVSENRDVDDRTDGVARQEANDRIRAMNVGAITCYALAGALLGGYVSWTLATRGGDQVDLQVIAVPTGELALEVRF